MPPKHSEYKKNACKYLFTVEMIDLEEVQIEFPEIGISTLKRWAGTKEKFGPDAGLSWYDIRDKNSGYKYQVATQDNAARVVLEDIHKLMTDSEMDPATRADALSKLMKFHDKLVDPKGRVGAHFAFLKDFSQYTKEQYPELYKGATGDVFVKALKSYKNDRLKRILG